MTDPFEIIDKVRNKNWKIRIEGYEILIKIFSDSSSGNDQNYSPYLDVVKGMVIDSNAAAQEKALQVTELFVKNSNIFSKVSSDICNGIVNKCINATRQKTKEKAIEILKLFVELEKHDVVVDELIKGLSSKTPKIVAACIGAFKEILHDFGPKIITAKEIFKFIPKLMENRDSIVRESGKELVTEFSLWLGRSGMEGLLGKLKPILAKELAQEFDKLKNNSTPKKTRYLKSQKPSQPKAKPKDAEIKSTQNKTKVVRKTFLRTSKLGKYIIKGRDERKTNRLQDTLNAIEKLVDHTCPTDDYFAELARKMKNFQFDQLTPVLLNCLKWKTDSEVKQQSSAIEKYCKLLGFLFSELDNETLRQHKGSVESILDALMNLQNEIQSDTTDNAEELEDCICMIFDGLRMKIPEILEPYINQLQLCYETPQNSFRNHSYTFKTPIEIEDRKHDNHDFVTPLNQIGKTRPNTQKLDGPIGKLDNSVDYYRDESVKADKIDENLLPDDKEPNIPNRLSSSFGTAASSNVSQSSDSLTIDFRLEQIMQLQKKYVSRFPGKKYIKKTIEKKSEKIQCTFDNYKFFYKLKLEQIFNKFIPDDIQIYTMSRDAFSAELIDFLLTNDIFDNQKFQTECGSASIIGLCELLLQPSELSEFQSAVSSICKYLTILYKAISKETCISQLSFESLWVMCGTLNMIHYKLRLNQKPLPVLKQMLISILSTLHRSACSSVAPHNLQKLTKFILIDIMEKIDYNSSISHETTTIGSTSTHELLAKMAYEEELINNIIRRWYSQPFANNNNVNEVY